jgi:hypothetical protein
MFKMQGKFDELLVVDDIKVSSKVLASIGMEGPNHMFQLFFFFGVDHNERKG